MGPLQSRLHISVTAEIRIRVARALKKVMRSRTTWVVLSLVAMTVLAYAPVFHADFVNYDDPLYVTANVRTQQGLSAENIAWCFKLDSVVAGNWHPLTVLSHMLDVQLYGLDPAGHHRSSLLLHVLTAAALFLVLRLATGAFWRSAAVAALFALHPVNVESVAWISERKNVLSTFFWIAGVGAWLAYVRRPGPVRLGLTILMLFLGLLAKPMLVTFPFVLLLFDIWPLQRHRTRSARGLLIEKIPMFVLVLVFSLGTLHTQSGAGAMSGFDDEPLSYRAGNAVVAYASYMVELAWPHELSPYYPLPAQSPPILRLGLLLLGLAAVTVGAIVSRRRAPYFLVGWLWYLGVLVPVIGLVQVGNQAMADRYLYVPEIGIFIAAVWGIARLLERQGAARTMRWAMVSGCACIAFGLGWSTYAQATRWRDSETLFRYATEISDCNYFAHNNLGTALNEAGRLPEALVELQRAVDCQPRDYSSQMNLGTTYLQLGRSVAAERHLRRAVELKPDFATAHANLGGSLMKLRRFEEAIVHLRRALELDPTLQAARNNLERALERNQRQGE
jgi:tetratricopeptide (TPR) repeat protein